MTSNRPISHALTRLATWLLVCVGLSTTASPGEESDLPRPTRNYWAYVCAESEDTVSLLRFGPDGMEEAERIPIGSFPAEIEGPHGITVSPDGRYWFVSIAHGKPFGSVHKYSTLDNEWLGDAPAGLFPATLDLASTTGLLYVANANFYGDHTPSTISVIEAAVMAEVGQIDTGTMPHGARLSRDGKRLYSVNMMDDELVEIDALRFRGARPPNPWPQPRRRRSAASNETDASRPQARPLSLLGPRRLLTPG